MEGGIIFKICAPEAIPARRCYGTNMWEGDRLRHSRIAAVLVLSFLILSFLIFAGFMRAQDQPAVDSSVPPPPGSKPVHLKHLLVIGQTKGFEHDSVSDGMAAIYNMGH